MAQTAICSIKSRRQLSEEPVPAGLIHKARLTTGRLTAREQLPPQSTEKWKQRQWRQEAATVKDGRSGTLPLHHIRSGDGSKGQQKSQKTSMLINLKSTVLSTLNKKYYATEILTFKKQRNRYFKVLSALTSRTKISSVLMLTYTKIWEGACAQSYWCNFLIKVALLGGSDSQTFLCIRIPWKACPSTACRAPSSVSDSEVGLRICISNKFPVRLIPLAWEQTLRVTASGQQPHLSPPTKWDQHTASKSKQRSPAPGM